MRVTGTYKGAVLAALIAITGYGGYLRFQGLVDQSFWMDEAFSTVHARAILAHGYPLLANGKVEWHYFPAHYVMAAGLALFANLHWGARFFSALAGTILIPLFYGLNRLLFRSRAQAILAAALLAFLTYEIAWSRQARMYVFLQLFTTLSLVGWVAFLERRRTRSFLVGLLFLVLAVFTHTAGYALLVFLASAAVLELRNGRVWVGWARSNRWTVAVLCGLLAVCLAMVGAIRSNSNLVEAIQYMQNSVGVHYEGRYFAFLAGVLKLLLGWALVGALLCLKRERHTALSVIVMMAVYFFLISRRSLLSNFRYLLFALPFLFSFASYALIFLVKECGRSKYRPLRFASFGFPVLFVATLNTSAFNVAPRSTYYLDSSAPQPDWKKAFDWVAEDVRRAGKPVCDVTTITTFPVFHDLYLPENCGTKRFLPFSMNRYRGDYRDQPDYTNATTVTGWDLGRMEGYVILDRLGLYRLKDQEAERYLTRLRPSHVVSGPFEVYVWKLASQNDAVKGGAT